MTAGRAAARAALALAALLCSFAGWTYAQTRGDEDLAHARAREAVLADATRRVAELTSFDADAPGAARESWLRASTGALREELARAGAGTGPTARAHVTAAAVTALDRRAGTAELIATVEVETRPEGEGAAHTERKRLEALLDRTGGGWKPRSLAAVPVGGER
ncbi:hypothetical protein [Streptomyces sp. NPDC090029]|uniref:hypothetical protein n=1 Tax=Streptomyces sp. NPDC090029 TaxID=3365924 RepID=UPI0037FBE772